jgi:carboxymethylenebutenolidase
MFLSIDRKAGFAGAECVRWRQFVCFAAVASVLALAHAAPGAGSPQEGQTPGVEVKTVRYAVGSLSVNAYFAAPSSAGKHPGLIVIHADTGLDDQMRELTQRFAAAGFVAIAPSLSAHPAAPAGAGMQAPEDASITPGQATDRSVEILKEGYAFLAKYPGVDASRISSVGFGWGGWRSFMLAESIPTLYRAVIYCGRTPEDGLQNIHAPILAHYAQFDFRITGNSVLTEEKMRQMGKKFADYVYPNTQPAFFNEKSPQYNADAANLAWTRTLEFLGTSQ